MDYDDVDIRAKIEEYSSFIGTTLRPQLESAVKAREDVENDIKEYELLQTKLEDMLKKEETATAAAIANGPMDSLVDLGHEMVYCNAVIDDPNKIFVHTGMGFHVEMTLAEASNFVKKRIRFLRDDVLQHRTHRATTIAVHIEETLLVLQQLGKEMPIAAQSR